LTARQARPNVAVVPREPVAVLADPPADVEREARALAALCPRPARVGAVWCGTAGWTDPTLIACGRFYPANAASPADRLAHYASQFPMVEVDATYYAIPSPSVAQRWVERTPNGFVFDVKAHPVLTGHPLERARLPKHLIEALASVRPDKRRLYPRELPAEVRDELVARFRAVLEPLQAADKLGCVVIQLPPWTTATRGSVRELERLRVRDPCDGKDVFSPNGGLASRKHCWRYSATSPSQTDLRGTARALVVLVRHKQGLGLSNPPNPWTDATRPLAPCPCAPGPYNRTAHGRRPITGWSGAGPWR
jgi:uncharacterized protein YecE (DUF72 family)